MSILSLLEKRLPLARQLLEEAASQAPLDRAKIEALWEQVDKEKVEVVCAYGISGTLYGFTRSWLDENLNRRLIFIEEEGKQLAHLLQDEEALLLLEDKRVKIFCLESPLQIESIARQVAWRAVFQEMAILLLQEGEQGLTFKKALEQAHLASHLLLSEASDWGVEVARNAKANSRKERRKGMDLKGKFKGIPAVIVGAGPSLQKQLPFFQELSERALIFAGGAALHILPVAPHFAGAIDPRSPASQFEKSPFLDVPFCVQSRMNRENGSLIRGETLLFPDSSASWLNQLQGMEGNWESGWTVGNFLATVACSLGCSPIVFIGMDLCYHEGRKYAQIESPAAEGLIEVKTQKGNTVWTQRDWWMAAQWMQEFASSHPETEWINATEGGLGFQAPIQEMSLASVLNKLLPQKEEIQRLVQAHIEALPKYKDLSKQWDLWKQSLERCQQVCQTISQVDWNRLEDELAYQALLQPLWQIWKPVFERELEIDPHPLLLPEKIQLNQILFFQRVLKEHLDVFS